MGMASKVFVGNLAFKTTRDEVQQLFAQAGAIKDVFLPTDRESGRPRGFAFVEFESDEDAQKAIEKFNGYELSGRALRVNAAEDRPRGGPRPPRSFDAPAFDDRGGDFGGGGGWGGGGGGGGGKSKGSRRNIRGKKRSL
jgi:cold-inducible RNA-binding protein